MKSINDNTLDQLISQSLQRQHSIESINTQVLAAVKRYNRRQKTIRALRLIGFAFGVPTALAVIGYGIYSILISTDSILSYVAVAVAAISAIVATTHTIANFSIDNV